MTPVGDGVTVVVPLATTSVVPPARTTNVASIGVGSLSEMTAVSSGLNESAVNGLEHGLVASGRTHGSTERLLITGLSL